MTYVLAGLAVYKIVQLLDALAPREAMPWVKVSFGILFGYIAALTTGLTERWTDGLAVATIAGAVQATLRLMTLLGDWAVRKSVR
jgi:hypothetical protein